MRRGWRRAGRGGGECAQSPVLSALLPGGWLWLSPGCVCCWGVPRGSFGAREQGNRGVRAEARFGEESGASARQSPWERRPLPPSPTRRAYHLPQPRRGGDRGTGERLAGTLLPCPRCPMCQDEAGVDCARTPLCSRPPWVLQGCGGRCCRGPLSTPCAQATPAWHTHPAGRGETSREPLPHRCTGRGREGKPGRLMRGGGGVGAESLCPTVPSVSCVLFRHPDRALWASEA